MTMDLEVIDQSSQELGYFGDVSGGSKGLDVIMLKIVQPKNVTDTRKGGYFLEEVTGMVIPGFDCIVPLDYQGGRVLFPQGEFQKGVVPICKSDDGVFPILDNKEMEPQCHQCVGFEEVRGKKIPNGKHICQHAEWKSNPRTGKKIKPACQETALFTFADVQSGLVFSLNIKGTSISELKRKRAAINRLFEMSRSFGKPVPTYGLGMSMFTTKIDGKSGTWYELILGDPKPIENPFRFRETWRMIQDGKINKPKDEVAEAVDSIVDPEY